MKSTSERVKRARRFGAFFIAAALLLGQSSAAWASPEGSEATVLITEYMGLGQSEGEASFWWSSLKRPALGEFDRALQGELKERGVSWSLPATGGSAGTISKIYLRPDLAEENAATLGELLGAERLYYGSTRYEPVDSPGLSQERGVRAVASVKLLDVRARSSSQVVLTLERVRFASSQGEALRGAREALAEGLSELIAQQLEQVSGPIGPEPGEEPWLVLRGAERGARLQRAIKRLEALEEVSAVQVAWSAQGHIALQINPDARDPQSVIERCERALIESIEADEATPSGEATAWRWGRSASSRMAGGVVLEPIAVEKIDVVAEP